MNLFLKEKLKRANFLIFCTNWIDDLLYELTFFQSYKFFPCPTCIHHCVSVSFSLYLVSNLSIFYFFRFYFVFFSLSFFALSFSPSVLNRFQYLSKNQFFIWSIIAHIFKYSNIYSKYLNKNKKEKIFEDFSIQSQNFNLDKFNSSRN